MTTIFKSRFRRTAALTAVAFLASPLAAVPTANALPVTQDATVSVGQAQLTTAGIHDARTTFFSPNGHATIRIKATASAAGTIRVNGGTSEKLSSEITDGEVRVDISDLTIEGTNVIEIDGSRGRITATVDFPVLIEDRIVPTGVDTSKFDAMDAAIAADAGIAEDDRYTGAVILVAHRGRILHHAAVGNAEQLSRTASGKLIEVAEPRPMQKDTIFDMASVTKVAATTAAIMRLVDEGRITLESTLGELLPGFKDTDKAPITVRQLLTHRSGLWEWQPTWLHRPENGSVLPYLTQLDLRYGIGERRAYSDLGFMLLGAIVAEKTATPLDEYLETQIYPELGMTDTQFTPPAELRNRTAATSHGQPYERHMVSSGTPYPISQDPPTLPFDAYRNYTLVGEANDGNAWMGWDGVSGHAGLFSTALDLARYGQTLINGGGYGEGRLASAKTVNEFLEAPFDASQALGFATNTLPGLPGALGHAGFTGTQFAFHAQKELVVVFLTNRQHKGMNPGATSYQPVTDTWNSVRNNAIAAIEAVAERPNMRLP